MSRMNILDPSLRISMYEAYGYIRSSLYEYKSIFKSGAPTAAGLMNVHSRVQCQVAATIRVLIRPVTIGATDRTTGELDLN